MGTGKICVTVNKRASPQNPPCHRLWGAVCGRSTTARVSAHHDHLGGGEGQFRGSILEQDKGGWSLSRPPPVNTAPQRGSVLQRRWSV